MTGEGAKDRGRYQAYLVRCWQEGEGWRFSVEAIGQPRRQGYDDLSAVLRHLHAELGRLTDPAERGNPAAGGE